MHVMQSLETGRPVRLQPPRWPASQLPHEGRGERSMACYGSDGIMCERQLLTQHTVRHTYTIYY